ncbi:polymorphic toxin-type HINT domain-containing protein [Nonomuraea sp. NPDC003709]|uniref:polymorphic toxin-type HINT domain-containing protein n=1 Tax=Nonomuraea sp. NPDC003709 TaxID=3154450 RepID=UPI0033A49E77
MPGLLTLAVQPVAAEVQQPTVDISQQETTAGIPQQQRWAFGVAPVLVDSSVTQAGQDAFLKRQASTQPPGEALGPDRLYAGPPALVGEAPEVRIPRDGVERNLASRAPERQAATMAADPPALWETQPENGIQSDTLTPQLRLEAYGSGSTPIWEVGLQYEICEVTNTGGTGSCTTSPWKGWTEPYWTVPAGTLKWGKTYTWKARARDNTSGATSERTGMYFTTGVRQPLVSSLLATSGVNGQEFHQMVGNYTTAVTDASVAAAGSVPLSVVRSYNSLDRQAKAMFGAGWSTRFDTQIKSEGGTPESLLVTYPDGRQLRFVQQPGKNAYQSPPGMYFTLTKQTGGGWKLMDKQSTVFDFDAQGRLLKVADSRGRGQQLSYTDGKLTKVVADGGRSLTFAWTGDHVTAVSTDPVDGAPLTWNYQYDGDRLAKVCAPGQDTTCTVYTYDSVSRYRETVLDSRPVNYFRLGEVRTSGTVKCLPDEVYTVECKSFGSGVLTGQPGALSGTTNAAATFQGSGRSSYFETYPMLPKLGAQMSVEAWFKTTKSGFIYWAQQGGYSQGGWNPSSPGLGVPGLYVGTDGKLRGMLKIAGAESGATPVTSQQAVNDGQWHHAVITAANKVTTLYVDATAAGTQPFGVEDTSWVNGSLIGTGAADSSLPGTPANVTQPSEFGFQGSIDEVAFYNRALTAAEVRTHYDARAEAALALSKITLPSGRTRMSNTYDPASGRLSTHTDSNGGTWTIGVPVLTSTNWKSAVTVIDPLQNDLKFEYDPRRGYRPVSATDQLDKKTSLTYDTGGFLSEIIDPNTNKVTRTNDERGNVISTTTCRTASNCQTVRTQYYLNTANEFDPRNDRVTKIRDARSASATDNTYATAYEYNSYGELTKQTTPATLDFPSGRSTTVTYTDGTEPAIGGGTTPAGLVKTRSDAKTNTTSFGYTAAGDLAEQTDPGGLITQREHDAVGRLRSQTQISDAQPAGVKTTFTYDDVGRLATQTAPGVKNEITGVVHTAQTGYTYDEDGNTLTATVKDLTGGDAERQTGYTYDAYGHRETVTDPEGGMVRTGWDTLGRPSTVTDQVGAVFGYTYTERGQLASTKLKNWTSSPVNPQPATEITLASYSYDDGGRLAAQADAMGRKTSYTYFGDNLLSQVIGDDVKLNAPAEPAKDVVLEQNTYDAAGYLKTQTIAADPVSGTAVASTDYVYDAAGRLTSQTFDPGPASDPAKLARKTAYSYDANNNITATKLSAAGTTRVETTEHAYNNENYLTATTVKNDAQDLTQTWKVDDRGLVESMVDPRGNTAGGDPGAYTTSYRYDALGRLVERKAPTVQIEKNGTAQPGRPATRFGYDTAGQQTHTIDAEGRQTTSGYDRAGRLTSTTGAPYTPPGGTAVTPTISYAYDPAGRLIKTTDPRGYATSVEYDALGNAVRVTDPPAGPGQPAGQWISEYDLVGEELAAIDPTGARTQATYDDLGRQITRTTIERKPAQAAYTTSLEYNNAGDLTKVTLPGPGTKTTSTSYTVNAAGEVITETDPAGNITRYGYDLAGRPAKTTDAEGNATAADYDLAGRLTGLKSLDSTGASVRTVGYGYDAADNLTQITSGEGHITRRTFDASNLLTQLLEPVATGEQITTSFGYNATGQRTRLTDGRGNAAWTSYNTLGLIETLTEPATTAHPNLTDRTWTHLYDASGNETALIKPGAVRLDRQYDALNRLTKVSGSGAGIVVEDKTYGYDLADRATTVGDQTLEYNDRSLLTKRSTPAGTSTAYAYDGLGNPTQRADVTGTTTFTWDDDNRLKTVTDPVSGRTNTYDYDKADRLKTITSANPANTQAYTYDALDRPLTQTLKNSSGGELAKITYGWDKDDNLTSKTSSGLAGAGTSTYGYDHAGRLTSWTAPDGTTTAYEWDAAGNRTKAGDKTYTYDERNRLTSGDGADYSYTARGTLASQTKNGTTRYLTFDAFDRLINDGDATYTYDVFDRLSSRQSASGQQRFVYAGLDNDIVAITDQNGIVQSSYGRDPFGDLVSVKDGANPALGAFTDMHQDLVGTFSGTALAASTAYTPFGEVAAQTGTKTSLGYQSEYTDPDTGNVNMHARWYQPGTGAFTSRDDWTLPSSPSAQANRYIYGNANPLAYQDPTGHAPCPGTEEWRKQNVAYHRGDPACGGKGGSSGGGNNGDSGDRSNGNGRGGTPTTAEPTERSERRPSGNQPSQPASPEPKSPRPKTPEPKSPKPKTPEPKTPKPKSTKPKSPASKPELPRGGPTDDYIDLSNAPIAHVGSGGGSGTPVTALPAGGTPSSGTPTVTPVDLPSGDLPPGWTPPLQPPNEFWQGAADTTAGIFQGVWDMTCIVCHLVPGFGDLPQLPSQALFGTDPTSPEYQTGRLAPGILSMFIAPEVGPTRPGVAPKIGGRTAGRTQSPPCLNSFAAGTQVLMADGTRKNIEDVEIGDKVRAADPETGQTEAKKVTVVHRNVDTDMTDVTIKTADGQRSVLHTTVEHPFWNSTRKAWVNAGDLRSEDVLHTSDGRPAVVVEVRAFGSSRVMYNLTVADIHTYFVFAGNIPILVHNDGEEPDWLAELRKSWDPGNADDDGYHAPSSRVEQDKDFKRAVKEIQRNIGRTLSKAEERQLHDEITKRGYGYDRIVEEGKNLFKGC